MNVLILLENNKFKKWHLNCLEVLKESKNKVFFYNFSIKKKIKINNLFYYLFKFINKPNTENDNYNKIVNTYKIYNEVIHNNNENSFVFSKEFNKFCKKKKIELIIRFGLGIIQTNLRTPIISFHHGDPRKYRGRPSGFYEIANKEKTQGQIVQILTSKLDAGKVLSYGETKVCKGSYKKTLFNSYSISHLLLKKALISFKKKKYISNNHLGKIYKIPSNYSFLIFLFSYIFNKIEILYDKLFFHKKWNLKKVNFSQIKNITHIKEAINKLNKFQIKNNANFLADPFFYKNKIICEYTNPFSQKGKLAIIDNDKLRTLKNINKHISFPSAFHLKEKNLDLIFPETASWQEPSLFRLSGKNLNIYKKLKLDKKRFLLDPIIFKSKGYFYLFGNDHKLPNVLFLWISKSLNTSFKLHPSSPIIISPVGSRMAGQIINIKNKIYRVSQDNSSKYGNGIIFHKIIKISKNQYKEVFDNKLNFKDKFGPHTLSINYDKKTILTDYYKEKFSIISAFVKLNPFW